MTGLTCILGLVSFVLGAFIASFLNVVIWRVPRGESVVSPRSHCPKCGTPIKGYQNIPILSWLALRGRCAGCRAPISPRYIAIETIGGCLFLAAFLKFGHFFDGPESDIHCLLRLLVVWIWISLMIVGSMIDYDHKLLPDFVTVGGMVLGVVWSVVECLLAQKPSYVPLLRSVTGLVSGFGLFWLIRHWGTKVFKREAMGLGDVYLMGAIGALFGCVAVLVVLLFSSLVGTVWGLTMLVVSKTRLGRFVEMPYGPFICMGCVTWMFFGPELVRWYLSLFR